MLAVEIIPGPTYILASKFPFIRRQILIIQYTFPHLHSLYYYYEYIFTIYKELRVLIIAIHILCNYKSKGRLISISPGSFINEVLLQIYSSS
jgi:hypothetical protein